MYTYICTYIFIYLKSTIFERSSSLMINGYFANEHHQMEESQNNCFGSKKSNTPLRQMKIVKCKCSKIAATYCNKKHHELGF